MGDKLHINTMVEMRDLNFLPVYMSATTARETELVAAAPNPCRALANRRIKIVGENTAAIEPASNKDAPIIRTGRRPIESDSAPQNIWPIPRHKI